MLDFPKPKKITYHDRETVYMKFGELGDDDWLPKDGVYMVRGGIAWPALLDMATGFHGYALICGVSVDTKKAYIFEEQKFTSVDHVMDNGVIEKKGISSWWNSIWDKYYCNSYYYHDNKETHKKYMMQSLKSRMVAEPKPVFLYAKWQEDEQALQSIWERGENNKLYFSDRNDLFRAVRHYKVEEKHIPQEIWALMACLCGLGTKRRVV